MQMLKSEKRLLRYSVIAFIAFIAL